MSPHSPDNSPAKSGERGAPDFEYPVVFVAERLESRWGELVNGGTCPSPDELPSSRFLVLEDIWVISTYLRLRRAGLPVEIDSSTREGAINVACSPRIASRNPLRRGMIVSIRADRARQVWGDLSLVQNPLNLRSERDWLIDHWPQPNIIPRNPDRGDRIERIGILSPVSSIAPEIRDPAFTQRLDSLGFELVIRSDGVGWNDYSDLDLQIAMRSIPAIQLRTKPATKIVQAWIAGCPAITGVEPAFRSIGRPGMDYLEASSASEVIDRLCMLRDQPSLYRSLIVNGAAKAALHDERAVLQQWELFLRGPATNWMRRQVGQERGLSRHARARLAVYSSLARHRIMLTWVKAVLAYHGLRLKMSH